jgi:hypothetical protein
MSGEAALERDGTVAHDRRRHAGGERRDPGLVWSLEGYRSFTEGWQTLKLQKLFPNYPRS